MKRLTKISFLGLWLGLLVCALVLLTGRPTPAAPLPAPVAVTVTNTPLPITGNVNVTNASLPVTGTLSGTITNPANNPVPVSNINDSADHEISGLLCETDIPGSTYCGSNAVNNGFETISLYTVPAVTNKGLKVTQAVIEFVTGVCEGQTSDDIINVSLNTPAPAGTPYYLVPTRALSSGGTGTNWTFSQTTKIYAYPRSAIAIEAWSTNQPSTSGAQFCSASFSGTLLTQ